MSRAHLVCLAGTHYPGFVTLCGVQCILGLQKCTGSYDCETVCRYVYPEVQLFLFKIFQNVVIPGYFTSMNRCRACIHGACGACPSSSDHRNCEELLLKVHYFSYIRSFVLSRFTHISDDRYRNVMQSKYF